MIKNGLFIKYNINMSSIFLHVKLAFMWINEQNVLKWFWRFLFLLLYFIYVLKKSKGKYHLMPNIIQYIDKSTLILRYYTYNMYNISTADSCIKMK